MLKMGMLEVGFGEDECTSSALQRGEKDVERGDSVETVREKEL